MSIHDNERLEKKDGKGKGKQMTLPWAELTELGQDQAWEDVEALLIAYVVQAVCGGGGSVQFTRTRDGGALGVRVYDDNLKTATEWGRIGEGLEEALFRIADYYRNKVSKDVQRWS